MRYLDPRSVKISLIVTSDDFLNEVTAGSESPSLPEEKRRSSVVERLAHVENRLQVTVHPIVSGHRRRRWCVMDGWNWDFGNICALVISYVWLLLLF